LANVEGVRIGRRHPGEQVPGSWHVPCSFIKVGQRVPLSEVSFLWSVDASFGPLQQGDGTGQVALVGPAAGRHDPAFGDQLAAR
jgi:hypothetical protein